jgi:hypothetical protein
MLGPAEKITVTPAPVLGSYLEATTNTLVLDSTTLADLGKARDCDERARTGKGKDCEDVGASDHFGALCADDAAAVIERGEWGREQNYHSRELSTRCATYLLRLRYVVLVRTSKMTGANAISGVNEATSFDGSAALVDLDAKKVIGAFRVQAASDAVLGTSVLHNSERNYDYRVIKEEAKGASTLARGAIAEGLVKAFPGATDADYARDKLTHPTD